MKKDWAQSAEDKILHPPTHSPTQLKPTPAFHKQPAASWIHEVEERTKGWKGRPQPTKPPTQSPTKAPTRRKLTPYDLQPRKFNPIRSFRGKGVRIIESTSQVRRQFSSPTAPATQHPTQKPLSKEDVDSLTSLITAMNTEG